MRNILYIHGYKSTPNSRTAVVLQQCIGNKYKVFSPAIPESGTDALAFVSSFVRNNNIQIVVASSLGAFIALQLKNTLKIVINPCCHPVIELSKLSASTKTIETYKLLDQKIWNNIDAEERILTFGIFSNADELFSYQSEFSKYYNNISKISDGHRISPSNIKNVVCPLIADIYNTTIPQISKYFGNVSESFQTSLNEAFVNALTKEDMYKYADEVWNILQKSYASIGGLQGNKDVNQLIDDSDMWKMVRRNGKIVCVTVYSFKHGGRKTMYGGTDGTQQGKQDFYKIISEDILLKSRCTWSEVSGPMEHIMIKNGAMPIPSSVAKNLLKDKEFVEFNADGYHYTRSIGGILTSKLCVGNIY